MARSVSVPCNAQYVAYQAFDGDDFDWHVDDLRSAITDAFPYVTEDSEWVGREDRAIASNQYAYFGVSEYCGLVSVWVVPRENDYADDGRYGLRNHWISQIETKFRKTVAGCFGTDLYRQATFSNGEAFFQPMSGQQQGQMGLGYSSKEGWL